MEPRRNVPAGKTKPHSIAPHTVRFAERVQTLIDHPLDVNRTRMLRIGEGGFRRRRGRSYRLETTVMAVLVVDTHGQQQAQPYWGLPATLQEISSIWAAVANSVSRRGILAMIGELRVNPSVQRRDQLWIACSVFEFRSVSYFLIRNRDLPRLCRF